MRAYSVEMEAVVEGINSTREELRAQVAACYLVRLMEGRFGVPRQRLNLWIITDSKASIKIINNADKIVERRKFLDPGMDLGMEFARVNKAIEYANFQHN